MPSITSRLGRLFSDFRRRLAEASVIGNGNNPVANVMDDANTRSSKLLFNRSLYENEAYQTLQFGGYREQILSKYFDDQDAETPFRSVYSPFRTIVDAYQLALDGRYGRELLVQKLDKSKLDPKLEKAIAAVWRNSNLDTQKAILSQWAANYGTVALRITTGAGDLNNTNPADKRVRISIESPLDIADFVEDSRGNVVAVKLKYLASSASLDEEKDAEQIEIVEILTKEKSLRYVDGTLEADIPNPLGICPFVIIRHQDGGDQWGKHAYHGSEGLIFEINRLLCNQSESVYEHIYPTWFASAGGDPPETVDAGRNRVLYVQSRPDTPIPSLEALVPQLDNAGATTLIDGLVDKLYVRQPELLLNAVKALSNQSGETVMRILSPIATRIFAARTQYEAGLVKAIQIAISMGKSIGAFSDLGTGTDTANADFANGDLDFVFKDRPALPPTPADRTSIAQAGQQEATARFLPAQLAIGIGVSQDEAFRLAGYDEQEIEQLRAQRSVDDAEAMLLAARQAAIAKPAAPASPPPTPAPARGVVP